MGVWAFSEQTLAEHSCGASLWLDRAPGLPAPPATFPVQLSPSSNITFPSKITARMAGGLEGFCQSSCTRALLRGSRQFSLVCCLREREGEREEQRRAGREGESARGGERESGREERSFTNRDRRRQKHLRELPLPTAAQEFSEHRSCHADHQNPGFEVGNYTSTRTFRADETDGTKVLEVRAPL